MNDADAKCSSNQEAKKEHSQRKTPNPAHAETQPSDNVQRK